MSLYFHIQSRSCQLRILVCGPLVLVLNGRKSQMNGRNGTFDMNKKSKLVCKQICSIILSSILSSRLVYSNFSKLSLYLRLIGIQVVSISRSFDIAQTDVQLMLQYFHRRGRLVYFADDPVLSRLVVVNPTWFVQTLSRAVDGFERSLVDSAHLLQSLADKELDRQLQVKCSGEKISDFTKSPSERVIT